MRGYEIDHCIATVDGGTEPLLDGRRAGSVWGTTWLGTFKNDGFRRVFPARAASTAVEFDENPPAGYLGFAERRRSMIDRFADMIEQHLDTDALLKLLQ